MSEMFFMCFSGDCELSFFTLAVVGLFLVVVFRVSYVFYSSYKDKKM